MNTGRSLRYSSRNTPALVEDPRVALGHLAAEDRLHPRRVGLVLAAGEREHPRAAVLDGDRGVEQRGDRVGDREQVARGQAAQRVLGPRRRRRPRRAASAASRRAAPRGRRGSARAAPRRTSRPRADLRRHRHRRADHEAGGIGRAELARAARPAGLGRRARRRARARCVAAPARRPGRGSPRRRCRPRRSASPWTRSSRVAPRSSSTRPRLARGRGFVLMTDMGQPSRPDVSRRSLLRADQPDQGSSSSIHTIQSGSHSSWS